MANDYYSQSGWPATNAAGASSPARSELALIVAGFDKCAPLSGQNNKILAVNSSGTGQTVKDVTGTGNVVLSSGATADFLALTIGGSAVLTAGSSVAWSVITGKPTSVSGYGITDALVTTNNLSDVGSASTARTNLGLGTMAVEANPITTKGDLLVRSSSALARLGIGTDGQVLMADSAQTAGLKWAWGKVVQVIEATPYTTYDSTSTSIPLDDTAPQITEGKEYVTVSITPKNVANRLVIEAQAMVGADGNRTVVMALFQDATTDALAVNATEVPGSASVVGLGLRFEMAAGTTSATTFRIRIGPSAGTAYVNGSSAARRFGGKAAVTLHVREVA